MYLSPPFFRYVVSYNLHLKNWNVNIHSFLNLVSFCILYCEGGKALYTVLWGSIRSTTNYTTAHRYFFRPELFFGIVYNHFYFKLFYSYIEPFNVVNNGLKHEDFANYKDEALEIYPTIVYATICLRISNAVHLYIERSYF